MSDHHSFETDQGVYATIESFKLNWLEECSRTTDVLKAIPHHLWNKEIISGYRTLARLAWHIVQTPGETLERTGLHVKGPKPETPVPAQFQEIIDNHELVSKSTLEEIERHWNDATLKQKDEMYGQTWTRSRTLMSLVFHAIHHRGQMTVLMRAGGAKVPGLYGPAKEDWAAFGMKAPVI